MRNTLASTSLLVLVLIIGGCTHTDNGKTPATAVAPEANTEQVETHSWKDFAFGGTYAFGENVDSESVGTVYIHPTSDSSALFFMDLCIGGPTYNMGIVIGELDFKDNIGLYDSKKHDDFFDCGLRFEFNADSLVVTTIPGHEDCGLGHSVYPDHTFYRRSKAIPMYFTQDGDKDTVYFDRLNLDTYFDF